MKKVSLVMPYYDNPQMLAVHYETWRAYDPVLKDKLEIVIVDDGSPNTAAAEVARPEELPRLKIYRVTVDLPWHQHAARNIGAFRAHSPWLLLTDIDHLLPETSFANLLKYNDAGCVYTFARLDAPDLRPKLHPVTGEPHPHPNSFAMTKELYWQVGGYDEDYCGVYGTDGLFRSRLYAAGHRVHLNDVPLVRYSREVLADASTVSLPRKDGREPGAKKAVAERKKRDGTIGKTKTLSMPYIKAFP